SGDLSQVAREKVLGKVRAGELRFLIATDVAARGIDIVDLSHVIQYDVPQHPETYIHRAGRTGRAGASGTAIMLVELLDQINLGRINKEYDIVMQNLAPPAEESTFEVIEQRARTIIRAKYRQLNANTKKMLDQYEEMVELLTMDEDGLRALSMLIDDFYQAEVHSGRKSNDRPKSIKPDSITNTVMADIAGELTEKMQTRDKLQFERMIRFEPLAESLAMSGLGFNALTMLVHEFHQSMIQPQSSGNGKKGGNNRRKPSSKRNNNGNRGRSRRGGRNDSNSNRRSSRGGRSSSSRSGRGKRSNNGNNRR
ncbi:MAG TPA: hypothetical protein ENJ56_04155, partial [Anaerolineae bacterium]|nr:hypothetical protein [Anaerolineae bacterium]